MAAKRRVQRWDAELGALLAFAALVMIPAWPAVADDMTVGGFRVMPQTELGIGAGTAFGEWRFAGMYRGIEEDDVVAQFNPTLILRDDATGSWLRLTGRELGLESRALRLEYERQGDWSLFLDLGQTPKSNPYEITTGLSGIGNPVQRVTGESPRRVEFKTERDRVEVGLGKLFGDNVEAKLSYRHEEKRGARQWGAQGFNFLAEPIDQVHRELSATASYADRIVQVSTGYLGSFFENAYRALDNDSSQPLIALPPDSQAHRVWIDGGLRLAPATRATFKTSYSIAMQDDSFATTPTFPGNTRSELGGRVDSLLAYFSLNTRPLRDLTVNLKLRHEDRDDRTDVAQYLTPSASRTGFNIPFSRRTTTGDLEAVYRLPERFRLAAGLRQERWWRSKPELRQASFRDFTDETTARLTLKRAVTDSLGGAIGYSRSVRTGSHWADGTDSRIDAIHLGDRDRHKVRGTVDWVPSQSFSAQLRLEYIADTYDSKPLGPREGETRLAALDLSYSLSPTWQVTAWGMLSDVRLDQASNGDGVDINGAPVTDQDWGADLRHFGRAAGVGLRGKLSETLTTGLNVQYAVDQSTHALNGLGGQDLSSLPDIRYRQTSVGAFFEYVRPRAGRFRLAYSYDRFLIDDWTWENWTYADGSTVRIPGREDAHFIGLSWWTRF